MADCPYGPGGLLIDDVTEVDVEAGRVVARFPVHADLPLTRAQRAHPIRHPRHVSGGLMVHMTGMLGFVHAYYVLGLRHHAGWIGYGGKIYKARFAALATMDAPMTLACQSTRVRRGERQIFARYTFRFTQPQAGKDALVYESEQAAMWMKVDDAGDEEAGS